MTHNVEIEDSGFDALVEELRIRDLRPTRPTNRGITKAGLISCRGTMDGQQVKVWSCFSERQTELRQYMSELRLPCTFPRVIATRRRLVVEEWVAGEMLTLLDGELLERVSDRVQTFMTECKNVDVDRFRGAFDYLDYLINRIRDSGIQSVERLHEDWVRRAIDAPSLLCHNDLSLENVIYDQKRDVAFIVDNEMLSVSKGWFLAWNNSFLRSTNRSPTAFLSNVPTGLVENAWILRQVGSRLLKHDHAGIEKLLENKRCH